MTGIILDAVLMLLLVAALGYGIRLEKKLTALRAGQMAFAGAVTELNAAAGRAENALGSLRASGEEADILHDRLIKARAVKQELDVLMAKAERLLPARAEDRAPTAEAAHREPVAVAAPVEADDRALRMAALAERIQGMASPSGSITPPRQSVRPTAGQDNISAIVHALTTGSSANQAAKHSLNRARVSLDEDLFAA